MKIESGVGNGKWARVDKKNRLQVSTESASYQHIISKEDGQSYQVSSLTTLANGTVVGLFLKNTSSSRNLIVTYIRHQIIDPAGGTALPNASCYFTLNVNGEYTSGGNVITPTNVRVGSGNEAEVESYNGNPTIVAGTEIDRWFTKDEADMNTYNKEGSLIIMPGQTVYTAYTGDHTSGSLYTRISFMMDEIDND